MVAGMIRRILSAITPRKLGAATIPIVFLYNFWCDGSIRVQNCPRQFCEPATRSYPIRYAAGMIRRIPAPHPSQARGRTTCVQNCSCNFVNPLRGVIQSAASTIYKNKRTQLGPFVFVDGGGGGNRTRVRKSYAVGATCLATSLVLTVCNPMGAIHKQRARNFLAAWPQARPHMRAYIK